MIGKPWPQWPSHPDIDVAHPQIILRIHNYAHVDAGLLLFAAEVATRILRDAKVEAKAIYCPLSQEDDGRYRTCPGDLGTNAFVLNILTPEMAGRIPTPSATLGYALTPCDEIATSCTINVFYFRVAELAARSNILPARLLGHVVVHEIGHILGVNHSSNGIMRGEWSRNDRKLMGFSTLNFSTDQAAQLRTTLLHRAAQQEIARNLKSAPSR